MKPFQLIEILLVVLMCLPCSAQRMHCARQTDFVELDVYYCKTFFGFYPHRYYHVDRDNDRNIYIDFADQSIIRYKFMDISRMVSFEEFYSVRHCTENDNFFVIDSLITSTREQYESMLKNDQKEIYWNYKYRRIELEKGDTLNFIDFGKFLKVKSLSFQRDEVSGDFGYWAKAGHKMKPLLTTDKLKVIIDFINNGGDGNLNYNFHHINFFLKYCDEKYLK